MLSYFDSSVLLAILLDEERREEAYSYWRTAEIKVSSILLKLETITVIRRTYEQNKTQLEVGWLKEKTTLLLEFLNEVNYRIIDEDIEKTVFLRKDLARCRTLDALHIAAALDFKKLNYGKNLILYSFDKQMHDLAEYYKFKTNPL